jgi:hypothetical protein
MSQPWQALVALEVEEVRAKMQGLLNHLQHVHHQYEAWEGEVEVEEGQPKQYPPILNQMMMQHHSMMLLTMEFLVLLLI